MSWGIGAVAVARTIAEYHKDLVATKVRFEALERQTLASLSEFKVTLEKLNDRVATLERECISVHCEQSSKITAISERLDVISEKAIHLVAFDAVKQATRERFAAMELTSGTSEAHNDA